MYALLLLLQEEAVGIITAPGETGVEGTIANLVLWLKLLVETLGAIIIGVGIIATAYVFLRSLGSHRTERYDRIRLTFARSLALALEFQLAADILGTAVAPSWDQIGRLAVIALVRTFLNYFLSRNERGAGDHRARVSRRTPDGCR